MTHPNLREPHEAADFPIGDISALPSIARASRLHRSYRALMQAQFIGALDSAASGLDLDLAQLLERVRKLSSGDRLSPAAYAALTTLSESLRAGDVTRVLDSLQSISSTPDLVFHDARFRIGPILTEAWETPFIESVRADRIEDSADESRIIWPVLGRDLEPEREVCAAALELLEEADPELAGEFSEYVTRVKLFVGRGYLGFSSPAAFGAIFIRLPDGSPLEYFLEHLVHELSHLTLNVMMAHDPLLENPGALGTGPLRADPRPLYQILHATFVLSRNVRVTRRLISAHPEFGYDGILKDFEQKYAEGLKTVRAIGEFTEAGHGLLEGLEPIRD